jgi:hypothetical protein
MKKERALKKNEGKKWIAIQREQILLPWVDPEVRVRPILRPDSRFMSVGERVGLQIKERRLLRSENI